MSWSISLQKPVEKWQAEEAIDRLEVPSYVVGPALEQVSAAQRVAKELLKTIPGPYVNVIVSGHANGKGWHKDPTSANDTITVVVSQVCEEDLHYYK